MNVEEAVLWLKRYQGYEPFENGTVLKHSFDLTDETVDVILSAIGGANIGEPLSLEQLREMDGQPVWIDFSGSTIEREPGWFVLKNAQGEEVYLVGKVSVYKAYEYYGKTWLAYAHPPAHIDREAWTAEWTVDEFGHKCSKCGEYLPSGDDDIFPQFCPFCGRATTVDALDELEKRLRG